MELVIAYILFGMLAAIEFKSDVWWSFGLMTILWPLYIAFILVLIVDSVVYEAVHLVKRKRGDAA